MNWISSVSNLCFQWNTRRLYFVLVLCPSTIPWFVFVFSTDWPSAQVTPARGQQLIQGASTQPHPDLIPMALPTKMKNLQINIRLNLWVAFFILHQIRVFKISMIYASEPTMPQNTWGPCWYLTCIIKFELQILDFDARARPHTGLNLQKNLSVLKQK